MTQTYTKDHCWQYDIRVNNLAGDLKQCNLTEEETNKLKVTDFTFSIANRPNRNRSPLTNEGDLILARCKTIS